MKDYERYITIQEAAQRLSRPEPEVWRMLETGELPAMLRAELKSNDGTSIGFDFALLPPEGVARVMDQGGDDFTLEWPYCGGAGRAVCFPARQSSIRVMWEPSLFPELMQRLEDEVPQATRTPGESPKPVTHEGPALQMQDAIGWIVKKPQRERAFNFQLFTTLKAMQLEGRPRPNAYDVLQEWNKNLPLGITKVMADSFDHLNGSTSRRALQKAINGLISTR